MFGHFVLVAGVFVAEGVDVLAASVLAPLDAADGLVAA
jgi:hypothetical protein